MSFPDRTRRTAIVIAALLAAWIGITDARAGKYYFEAGLGAGRIQNGDPLYGTGTPALGFNFAWNLMGAVNIMRPTDFFQVHVGAKYRNTLGRDGSTYYGLQTISPLFRFETPRLYVGGSMTPLVRYAAQAPTPRSLLSYDTQAGTIAYTVEAGLLWRMVPYFHFAIESAATMVKGPNGIGPTPVLELTGQLRFFIDDFGGSSSGSSGSRKGYDGWRYPFGLPIGD